MKKVFLILCGVDRSRVTGFKGLIDRFSEYEALYDREDVRHERKSVTVNLTNSREMRNCL